MFLFPRVSDSAIDMGPFQHTTEFPMHYLAKNTAENSVAISTIGPFLCLTHVGPYQPTAIHLEDKVNV